MVDTALSAAIKEAYAAAPTDVVMLHTLEFRHPAFDTPLRVVRDHADHLCTLENGAPANPGVAVLFVGYAFDVMLPEVTDAATPEVVITIDNVTQEIEDNIRSALQTADKVEVTYRPYLSTDKSAPQMNPPLTLTLTQITADHYTVTARARMGDFSNRKFPVEEYTAARFPGMVR